jgi:hypothetical protein
MTKVEILENTLVSSFGLGSATPGIFGPGVGPSAMCIVPAP